MLQLYTLISDGQIIGQAGQKALGITAGRLNKKFNAADTLTVTLSWDNPQKHAVQERSSELTVLRDETVIFQGQALRSTMDTMGNVRYDAVGAMSYLQNGVIVPQQLSGTLKQVVSGILASYNIAADDGRTIHAETVEISGYANVLWQTTSAVSVWKALSDLLTKLGGFMRVSYNEDGLCLDWTDHSGVWAPQRMTWGYNMQAVEIVSDSSDVATVMYAMGEDNLTATRINTAAAATYGHITTTGRFNANAQGTLNAAADEALAEMAQPMKTVRVTGVDRSDRGEVPFEIGDFVFTQSERHGLALWLPVSALEIDLSGKRATKVTLGARVTSLTDDSKAARTNLILRDLAGTEPALVYAKDMNDVYAASGGDRAKARER